MNLTELLYILGGVHAEELVKLFTKVFNVIYADGVRGFLDAEVGIDKKLGGFPEADRPDKNIYRLTGD